MSEITNQITKLFSIVDSLEKRYNRDFTLDGHLIGSLGECLIAEQFGLTPMPTSNKGYDATDGDGRKVIFRSPV